MKTTSEIAREAGLRDCTCDGTKGCLERFAELIRADERSKMAEQPAQQQEPICKLFGTLPVYDRAAQQEQNRQIDQLIQERDHRDEIIDKLCDAVLGPDRYEWSSQYFFEDAVREVEERMAEQPAQQEPVKHELLCICGCSWEIDADGNEELVSSPPAQRKQLTSEWYAQWIRNNYQDYWWNIATLCDEMTKAAHSIKENT